MDKRQVKTRLKIYDAFKGLLEEKKYEDISVKEILGRSGVSRTAFYANFESKDHLLVKLSDLIFEEVFSYQSALMNKGQIYDYKYLIYGVFLNFNKHKELLKAVFLSSAASLFESELRKKIWPMMESAVTHHEFYKEGVPERLEAHQLTHSMVSLLKHYVYHENAYSPEEMRDVFYLLYA